MAKTVKAKKLLPEDAPTQVHFNFLDEDKTQFVADLANYSDDIRTKLARHGLSQKLGDSYAGADSPADAILAVRRVEEQLVAGDWSVRAGGGGPRVTQLAEAFARVLTQLKGEEVTIDQAMEALEAMSDDDKKSVRQHPQVKAEAAKIRAEKAAKDLEAANAEAQEGGSSLADLLSGATTEETTEA